MRTWIIYELQTDKEGNTALFPGIVKTTENEAVSEFLIKSGYAAISTAYIHTVYLVTNDGVLVDKKTFMHGEAEPIDELH